MTLSLTEKISLFFISLLIVAFGQPVFGQFVSFLASVIGFALFFRFLMTEESPKKRFWLATIWFTAVQLVQLSWFLSHPYSYIIAVHVIVSFVFGLQFGLLGLLITPNRMTDMSHILLITGTWVLLEWSRLFVLSGFAFNPVGLSLSANIYSLQTASIWGAFGLSFWVMLTNLLALKFWLQKRIISALLFLFCVSAPYFYGFYQLKFLNKESDKDPFYALLVQPVFPIEECIEFKNQKEFTDFVVSEWRDILVLLKDHQGKKIDLIALPEFIVPFGTYTPIFNYQDIRKIFIEIFGKDQLAKLPIPQEPLALQVNNRWQVSNAYLLQLIADAFNASVIAGMEDVEDFPGGERRHYSSAQFILPSVDKQIFPLQRYDKQVLVPMGEYIPFSFCRKLAASYGITGSFTKGEGAKIFDAGVFFGTSICYEETFGHVMKENKLKGAEMLVNLTSDIWYPTVAQSHCDHARLRTVEMGIPLIRACNTGITTAFDCFGKEIATLGNTPQEKIWQSGALYVSVPKKTYSTIYSLLGDYLIVSISFLAVVFGSGTYFLKNRE